MPDFGRWTSNGGDPSLNEINRADRFFEALAAKQPVYSTDPAEAELAFLMSSWRDDVRDSPVTAPVTPLDAAAALQSGLSKSRGSRRSFAIVGSVAAAMLCVGGFGTAVYGAGPGDSLYGMRTAIFGQQEVTRNEQVSLASAQLQQVQQLIDNGQWQEAQDKLVAVSNAVQSVDAPVQSKQQLVDQWNALTYKVVEQNPAATLPPGEPLPVLPSSPLTWLPAPVVQATTPQSPSTFTTTSPSTAPSDTLVTSTPDSSVPPETVLTTTPPSEGSTTSSSTASSTSMQSSSASTSVAAPPTSATTVPPSSTATATATTTTTTTTVAPRESQATQQTSTAAVPPPVRSTSSVAEVPASSAPASAPAPAPAQPSEPAIVTAPAQRPSSERPSSERPRVEPTTTTLLPPS